MKEEDTPSSEPLVPDTHGRAFAGRAFAGRAKQRAAGYQQKTDGPGTSKRELGGQTLAANGLKRRSERVQAACVDQRIAGCTQPV